MIRLHEGSERIPLTVADFDPAKGTVTLVIQALGKTTRRCATATRPATPSPTSSGRWGCRSTWSGWATWCWWVAASASRRSIRSFAPSTRRETAPPASSVSAARTWCSGRTASRRICDDLMVCTDDGSYGRPGFVTEALRQVLETDPPDLVIAIGPLPMMNACVETTRPVRRQDHGVAQRHHGGRHRHVRLVPGHRRRRGPVRLRRRAGLRRPPGGLQGADGPSEAIQGAGRRGQQRLRARVQSGEDPLRGGKARLQEAHGTAPHPDRHAGARRRRSAPPTSRR